MNDPKVAELQGKLSALCEELRAHGAEVSDPQCAALCETSAEVIQGLETAFEHFTSHSERAWQK